MAQEAEGYGYFLAGWRMAYEITRKHQLKVLCEHGFDDLNNALLNLMVYPPSAWRASWRFGRTD